MSFEREWFHDVTDGIFVSCCFAQHCLVPKRCKEDPKLGTWVDTQRVQRKKMLKHMAKQEPGDGTFKAPGRLTADRTARLESIGFVWSLRDDWQKHYEELKAYKAKHGHWCVELL